MGFLLSLTKTPKGRSNTDIINLPVTITMNGASNVALRITRHTNAFIKTKFNAFCVNYMDTKTQFVGINRIMVNMPV